MGDGTVGWRRAGCRWLFSLAFASGIAGCDVAPVELDAGSTGTDDHAGSTSSRTGTDGTSEPGAAGESTTTGVDDAGSSETSDGDAPPPAECTTEDWFTVAADASARLDGLVEGVDYLSLRAFVSAEEADGTNDNTEGFVHALDALQNRGIERLFIPAGHYRIDDVVLHQRDVKLYGSTVGISLLDGAGPDAPAVLGNLDGGEPGRHASPHDLYFHDVTLASKAFGNCANGTADYLNNVFMMTGPSALAINEQKSCGSTLRGNIFLNAEQSHLDPKEPTISLYVTSIDLLDNVFGLRMDAIDWLETEFSQASAWTCLAPKLDALRERLQLPEEMDYFQKLVDVNGNSIDDETRLPILVRGNIVNANPHRTSELTDHILYFKGVVDIAVVENYFRGFYDDYLKLSGVRGAVIAYNNFDGPDSRTYIESCEGASAPGKKTNEMADVTHYRNRLGVAADGAHEGQLFTWNKCFVDDTPYAEESNIVYAQNVQDAAALEPGIEPKANDTFAPAHRVYRDNVTTDDAAPMKLGGSAEFLPASAAFEPGPSLRPFEGAVVPTPNLPPHPL